MKKAKYTYCLTLRLEPQVDELLAEAASDRRISKTDFIRAAIRKSLREHRTRQVGGEDK